MKKITKEFCVALFAISMMVTGCSNSGDNDGDKSSPAPSEQPANSGDTEDTPETPSNPEFENPESEDPDSPVDSGETETEDTVTFETLGIEAYAGSLTRAIKDSTTYDKIIKSSKWTQYKYENRDIGFILIENFDSDGEYYFDSTCIRYRDTSTKELFYVPVSMESEFDQAIAAYKAAHAE